MQIVSEIAEIVASAIDCVFAYNPIILDKKQQFMPKKDGSCQKY